MPIQLRQPMIRMAINRFDKRPATCLSSLYNISASIALLGGVMIPYELNEDDDWGLCQDSVQRAIDKARRESVRDTKFHLRYESASLRCACSVFVFYIILYSSESMIISFYGRCCFNHLDFSFSIYGVLSPLSPSFAFPFIALLEHEGVPSRPSSH